ncbi:GNAT family N-acetyltransferase [Celeribacter baekdonensis]|uniref:GNAT family N-acetyltransferase n=1 Tax=Celeribacter baekdonensis TaxID=875171 RepID=UPI003A910F4D
MKLRRATPRDLGQVLQWAAAEGWNPGLDDASAFWGADGDGFFVAEVEDQIVAAISVVNHDADFAFLGLYLCLPAFRGRGIGYALWTEALKHAGTRTVGLDGVAAQEANYAKSGFVKTGSTARFEGGVPVVVLPGLRPMMPQDITAIATLDRLANGYMRPCFLSGWLLGTETRQSVVCEKDDEITGFATARLCHQGCKIGPVIAPDQQTALALMHSAAQALGASDVIVDVPDLQQDFRQTLIAQGFELTFETARMYRGRPPNPPAVQTLYGIATMELG